MIGKRSLLESRVAAALRCPVCRGPLVAQGDSLACAAHDGGASFPVIDGVPVLLNEQRSLFTISATVAGRRYHGEPAPGLKQRMLDSLPSLSRNLKGRENLEAMDQMLRGRDHPPTLLVIGGGGLGVGLDRMVANPAYDVVESDVYFGERTNLVCDAHDLPFADKTFDAVVIQAVINTIVDPVRGVGEIHRVLRDDGLVYAEAPFMQQICEGSYDFYRFSHLGLRRLFRNFEEIRSGAQNGPGMAAAWAYQHFLWSFVNSRPGRVMMRAIASLTGFWMPALDRFLIDRPAGIDAAAGVFFLGRRSETTLSDRDLIAQYRGWQR